MKRAIRPLLAFTLIGVVAAAAFLFWSRDPALVRELRALPEVGKVEYHGSGKSGLTVLHLRDWQFVPKELVKVDRFDYADHLDDVEDVQGDQLSILRYMIRRHGVREIYLEGLTEEFAPIFRVRAQKLREFAKERRIAKRDGIILGATDAAAFREIRLEAGTVSRLLEEGEIDNALPLEREADRQAANPIKDGKIIEVDDTVIAAWRRALVQNLPAQGLAVVVLGGSNDLRDLLPVDAMYVRVTPRRYPEE